MGTPLADLRGSRFGRLVVVERVPNKGRKTAWRCQCDCGNAHIATADMLKRGQISSCGCYSREVAAARMTRHGHRRRALETRVHLIWRRMLDRCRNPRDTSWPRYGARGIRVCGRWLTFENFLADMGEPPLGLSIERLNNDGDYSPENCVWADSYTQMRNRSNTKFIVLDGVKQPVIEACERYGVPYKKVNSKANARRRIPYDEAFLTILANLRGTTRDEAATLVNWSALP